MRSMELSVVYAGWAPTSVQQDLARRAEAAGFYRLWTTEGLGSDGLLKAMTLGLATSTIRLGTGIAYSFPRSPFQAAAGAAVLAEALQGRFTLGLGAGTRGLRRRYGIEEDHPAARFAEYADLIRGAWQARGSFEFAGRFFTAQVPAIGYDTDRALLDALEIHGSGVNRIILRTSAEHCHGVALHPLAGFGPYLDEVVVPALADGAQRAQWRAAPLWTSLWYITSVHDDPAVARERAARLLAFYFSTPSYQTPILGTRWEQTGAQLRDGLRAGRSWDELTRMVPPAMVEETCLAGTAAEVRDQLSAVTARLAPLGIDELVLEPPLTRTPGEFEESVTGIISVLAPEET
jgi:alkanesulfonate monooxygenase SsuD/methylene tetrahydromethanopterin reductase-like flavin-dependent oxidoreductase (luciferase family)